jgi:hypothetical protein
MKIKKHTPALLAALLLARIVYRLLRRRPNLSLCPTCSYNLQPHAPGQRCPECGTPIPSSSKSSTRIQ